MRICLASPLFKSDIFSNSGIANYLYNQAHALGNSGEEVHVLTCTAGDPTESQLDGSICIHRVEHNSRSIISSFLNRCGLHELALSWRYYQSLTKLQQKHKFDIIETNSYLLPLLFYSIKKTRPRIITRIATPMKTVWLIDQRQMSLRQKITAKMEGFCLKLSDKIVTHSEANAALVEKLFKIRKTKIAIIPLAVQKPRIKKSSAPDIQGKPVKVLFVGRLEPRKGIDLLLEAIPLVLRKMHKIEFYIVGEDKRDYESLFIENNDKVTQQAVNFLGLLNDFELERAYSECDFFVAPSRYESFGLIYVEAMIRGKPVVALAQGGSSEIITNNKHGILISNESVAQLAEAIVQLGSDQKSRLEMGQAAMQHANECFSIERLCQDMVKQYDSQIP